MSVSITEHSLSSDPADTRTRRSLRVELGPLTVDYSGLTLRRGEDTYLLTASTGNHDFSYSEDAPHPRRLYLLRNDFRCVLLDLPWSRQLWPRRRMGR